MFPLFYLLRWLGVSNADTSLLHVSYPWLGTPLSHLRAMGKSTAGFILAHAVCLLVYYSMYEACQLLWAQTIYDKSVPNGLPFLVYGLMMLSEYFSMISLRSRLGIAFFPRVTLLYFLLFHGYFFATAYGESPVLSWRWTCWAEVTRGSPRRCSPTSSG
jgi:hypothetical protein